MTREENRLEKRERIRNAARELFSRHGYEKATLRQIARKAHVGLGTLFHYARDKRDLVFLIFNEELAAVTKEALAAPHAGRPFAEQLLAIFATHYYFFSRDPVLSRLLLKELIFYSEGAQAAEFQAIRGELNAGIELAVREAQKNGRIRRSAKPELVARDLFFLFSGHVRWWIAKPKPHPFDGLEELKDLLALHMKGLL